MSEIQPQQWEIWHARFSFSEGKGYKYRPVVVVGTREDGSLVMMVTSAANKLSLPNDYFIQDWEAAGLQKPSIARADRIIEVPANYIGTAGRIGMLRKRDITEINKVLQSVIEQSAEEKLFESLDKAASTPISECVSMEDGINAVKDGLSWK